MATKHLTLKPLTWESNLYFSGGFAHGGAICELELAEFIIKPVNSASGVNNFTLKIIYGVDKVELYSYTTEELCKLRADEWWAKAILSTIENKW